MRPRVVTLLWLAPLIALLTPAVTGHPGRTDANGGHHDRKNGGYHYHRTPSAPRSRPPASSVPRASPAPPRATPELERSVPGAYKVVGVHDGDTITVLSGTSETKIRLHGIDAPEMGGQPFAEMAKQVLSGFVFGRTIELESHGHDHYGRTIARVRLAGRDINEEMVRAGLAWWYREYAPSDAQLEAAEAEARSVQRGLWSHAEPIPPWEWRRKRSGQYPRAEKRDATPPNLGFGAARTSTQHPPAMVGPPILRAPKIRGNPERLSQHRWDTIARYDQRLH